MNALGVCTAANFQGIYRSLAYAKGSRALQDVPGEGSVQPPTRRELSLKSAMVGVGLYESSQMYCLGSKEISLRAEANAFESDDIYILSAFGLNLAGYREIGACGIGKAPDRLVQPTSVFLRVSDGGTSVNPHLHRQFAVFRHIAQKITNRCALLHGMKPSVHLPLEFRAV